ncbi:MAG: fasciclin domain-containing protein [Chloracidobacterium sp.]|nr:fasciclin domain-containing protein [Chloracidobacterium sp.]
MKLLLTFAMAASMAVMSACGGMTANNTAAPANTAPKMASANTNTNTAPAPAEGPMVGGAAMLKTKDIIDNASNSKDHTTLVAAVKAAGLVDTLKGAGPFTVFAPVNAAFDKLPKGTVDTLLKPESKKALTGILTYHVVPGKMDVAAIIKGIEEGKGKFTMKTVAGGTLTATMEGKDVTIADEKGGKSKVTIADVMQSNGVIHVVDSVLMPK